MRNEIRLAAAVVLTAAATVSAFENYLGTPFPVLPAPSVQIPGFLQVPGKEYSDFLNISTKAPTSPPGAIDPGQSLIWDGTGGVADGIDFDLTIEPGSAEPITRPTLHVDALANNSDALFMSIFGGANSAAMLVSHTRDGNGIQPLFTESIAGTTAVWALDTDLNNHDRNGPPDTIGELDGIEVWGGDGVAGADSNRYSLFGDSSGIAIYTSAGTPFVSQAQIAAIIGVPSIYALEVDLDALMTLDDGDNEFEPGEKIIFSIRPLVVVPPVGGPPSVLFDGGEVWEYTAGNNLAFFVRHGGHAWDTAFDVRTAFGVPDENIDGLEAIAYVPEPAGTLPLVAGALLLASRRRR